MSVSCSLGEWEPMKTVTILAGLSPRPLFSVTRVKRPLLFVLPVCEVKDLGILPSGCCLREGRVS